MRAARRTRIRLGTAAGPPRGRPRRTSLAALLAATWLAAVPAGRVGAVACPTGGAKVKVCINNPTGTTTPSITVSGAAIYPQGVTCTGPPPVSGSYSQTLTVGPNSTQCTSAIPANGLLTGLYVHRINVTSTKQDQYQKGAVLFTSSPTAIARVDWTYFPNVIRVGASGDAGGGSCPLNSPASGTCDVRSAITAANAVIGTTPVLVQFNVSPGTLSGTNLTISRTNVTLDGTDVNGNPRIVGDPNAAAAGTQGPFPTVLDFGGSSGFRLTADGITLQGLDLRQNPGSESALAHLIWNQGQITGTVVRATRLDAGTDVDCLNIPGSCAEQFDLVQVPGRSLAAATPDIVLDNVEARSAVDKGLQLGSNTWTQINRSWIRNNFHANIQALSVDELSLDSSVIERAGLRASDDKQVDTAAHGLNLLTDGFVVSTGTIIRNNVVNGVRASGVVEYRPKNDYICGNGSDGLLTVPSGGIGPDINGFGGVTASYNQASGANIVDSVANLADDSSFTANADCGLAGDTSIEVYAANNQWRDGPPPSDACGDVDSAGEQDETNMAITLIGTNPTNALLLGQTVRVLGAGFNSITGNPLAGAAGCETGFGNLDAGQSQSCCNMTARANGCGTGGQNPIDDNGNCVEIRGYNGTWYASAVKSVTPAMIEAQIPVGTFPCMGGQPTEQVSVCKKAMGAAKICQVINYCSNAVSF